VHDLVVLSHLRWGFVYQRPQHLLSRFARDRRVLFIEEPIHNPDRHGQWEIEQPLEGLVVCRLFTRTPQPGFNDEQNEWLEPAIKELLDELQFDDYAVWFYTPMALPLLEAMAPKAIIYDCMDELSAFLHAPQQLHDREQELLDVADLVFTGGPSLYRAKKDRHPSVHCFTSSVDRAHFAQALPDNQIEEPLDQRDLAHPRIGYYGVIDERIDLELLARVADLRPDYQFVMVGPVVKIDPATLPQRDNIHYLGGKKYEELPGYLAGWDLSMMPFALNESTKFISPTKTIEYMAAEKSIVSTRITDVAEPYEGLVPIADSPEEFAAACDAALGENWVRKSLRIARMRKVLDGTSWDNTAGAMSSLIEGVTSPKVESPGSQSDTIEWPADGPSPLAPATPAGDVTSVPVAIVGAGPTGLSAAYHLGEESLLVERNSTVGGWCRSLEQDGFTFDFAGHIMFSNDPYVHQMYEMLLGDNVHWQAREAWIYSKNVFTRYPFQGALYGLPSEVITECIMGAIEARYGKLDEKPEGEPAAKPAPLSSPRFDRGTTTLPTNGNGHAATNGAYAAQGPHGNGNGNGKSHANGNGSAPGKIPGEFNSRLSGSSPSNGNGHAKPVCEGDVKDCCGDGILESSAPLGMSKPNGNGQKPTEPQNFEEFIHKVWGAGIAKHFAIPYNQKLWAVPLSEMETSWLGGRVPLPDLRQMIEGALAPVARPMGPNANFGYPLRGGFQALMNGFLPRLKGNLWLGSAITGFSPIRHELTLADGRKVQYEALISTMPLPVLVKMAGDEAPAEVRRAAAGLRFISVRCVNIGVGRENLTDKHWIYYPEDPIFHRIFVQGNASPYCNAPGGFGLTCEITYHDQYKPLPVDGDELIERCIDDCRKVGIIGADDPIWHTSQVDMPHAYVVYDHQRAANVKVIRQWLASHQVILAGRYSEWEYYNSDHAFLAGKRAAEEARQVVSTMATV
jgi:UDP-galactopyranose mutase